MMHITTLSIICQYAVFVTKEKRRKKRILVVSIYATDFAKLITDTSDPVEDDNYVLIKER